ncbi:dipeptide ABC transporter ATP-binding protein [Pseudoroseomonas wenyumeiae]|uniref:ABC transporter ATP-binding protein n=1 Tax=Teichococcus wenyumeiae TaxID=2478470 RepID=A0A3A9K4G8_9PROT|nr:ABC transporter ATP-binding protein [Pseudoroseomonas wenyumeiae]RMI19765.1 dipeptide ABC transporter ATP-binding protein [Pseudoroseomonas wenyumeiae]
MSALNEVPGCPPDALAAPILAVEDLAVEFDTAAGTVRAVDGVSWSVRAGETLGLVGESGCGKSVSALSVMRLLAKPAGRIVGGRVMFGGQNLLRLPEGEMRALRGRDISMIFQEPMTSLNPVMTVGAQLAEPLRIHLGMTEAQARARSIELLGMVGIPDGARRLAQYPHQFSGGMRQRVMIAIGLACEPKVIIADEPTTALDVTIQAQILELMKDLSRRLGITLVLITHNLGIVARYADRLAVMYAGRVVEEGPAAEVFAAPRHPYTIGLLRSVPRLDRPRDGALETIEGLPPNLLRPPAGCRFAPRCAARLPVCEKDPPLRGMGAERRAACHRAEDMPAAMPELRAPAAALASGPTAEASAGGPLLEVRGLSKHFGMPARGFFRDGPVVRAVEDVSFTISRGETLGLVGESGCGKTTVGRLVLRLDQPSKGEILFGGGNIATATEPEMRALRTRMQVIFQDPYSSLNPRMTVGDTISEPLLHRLGMRRTEARERTAALLRQVGLPAEMGQRYPHQMSGGQRQRVGIARALAMEPEFIVCDEAVSALDVSVQGQIINLLAELQAELGLSYLFIAHDLAVVRHLSHRVVVMYLGRVMEVADRDTLYAAPLHPYTRALLDAAPVPDPDVERKRPPRTLGGELPSPLAPPSGCVFRTRCPMAIPDCAAVVPPLQEARAGHLAACIRV